MLVPYAKVRIMQRTAVLASHRSLAQAQKAVLRQIISFTDAQVLQDLSKCLLRVRNLLFRASTYYIRPRLVGCGLAPVLKQALLRGLRTSCSPEEGTVKILRPVGLPVALGLFVSAGVVVAPVAAAAKVAAAPVVTATIRVGTEPSGVVANPLTDTVYVADEGNDALSVINGRTNTITATIPVGTAPSGMGANPLTDTVYVANLVSDTVSVISG
jgi:YVTN family beta-propeller protein